MCVCTSACVYSFVWIQVCEHLCVYVYSEDILGIVPHVLPTLCFENSCTVLELTEFARLADWLVYEPGVSSGLCLPSTGITTSMCFCFLLYLFIM